MTDTLAGFDVCVRIGRSAVNKVFAAVEKAAPQLFVFKADATGGSDLFPSAAKVDGTVSGVMCDGALVPDEKDERRSVRISAATDGQASFELKAYGQRAIFWDFGFHGDLSAVITCELVQSGDTFGVALNLATVGVDRARLTGISTEVSHVLARGCSNVAAEQLKKMPPILVTAPAVWSDRSAGQLVAAQVVSQYERTSPHDFALALALAFDPGAAALTPKAIRDIKPMGCAADLLLAVDLRFLNRLIANALASNQTLARLTPDGWQPSAPTDGIRSISVRDDRGRLALDVRGTGLGVPYAVSGVVELAVVDQHLRARIVDLDLRATGWRGVLLEAVGNVLYALVRVIAAHVGTTAADQAAGQLLTQIDSVSFKLVIGSGDAPPVHLAATPVAVRIADDCVQMEASISAT
jgi:hypothetical protein